VTLLKVTDLTKTFGGLTANHKVSISLNEGEIVGLIGPNGAGKTTFFNCIAGYYQPDSGSIWFNGQDITHMHPHKICDLGLSRTFQKVRIFKDMSVLENVMVGSFLRSASRRTASAVAEDMLAFTGLDHKASMRGSSLTIADKKRLEIARALATNPKLLLLDEAIAGLNPKETAEAVELIRAIQNKGITILMVEHVMEVIMPISDRVVVLDGGIKIAEDVPMEIIRHERVIQAYLGE
jgi:branched-chain amino acid transport system ATP-binding protein